MTGMLAGLMAPFEPLAEADVAGALRTHWGIEPRALERLDSERDDTFRVATSGAAVLFKVAHPGDGPGLVELQALALRRVAQAEPTLPVPRLVPTGDGRDSALVAGRVARVLSWLPGTLMIHTPSSPALFRAAGDALGRISRAIDGVDHPAAHRVLSWDLARVQLLRPETNDPQLIELIDRFSAETAPALAALPHQLIHNDFHPANLLVDETDPTRLTGILDFGDTVHTARVVDLGVALAYLVPDEGSVIDGWRPFLHGYERSVPLLDAERSLIPTLAAARLVQRIVINEAFTRGPGAIRQAARVRSQLARTLQAIETEEW
jgi:hydroxylysine kinase